MRNKVLSILALLILEPLIYFIVGFGLSWLIVIFLNCFFPAVHNFMESNGCFIIGAVLAALDFIYGIIRIPRVVKSEQLDKD